MYREKITPNIKTNKPGLKVIHRPGGGRHKTVQNYKITRVNIYMPPETAENLAKVKAFIANLGPELRDYKTGETGKPLPSNSIILDRLLKVYIAYLNKLATGDDKKEALKQEFRRVTESDLVGSGVVEW